MKIRSPAPLVSSLLLGALGIGAPDSLAADPLRIAVTRDGPDLILTWPDGARLESAPSPAGPWTPRPSAAAPHRVTPEGTQAYFRVRQLFPLTVTRTGTGAGTVTSLPEGIACGDDCTEGFPSGQTATLRAVPAEGSTFAGWEGDCSGTGDCVVTLDRARSVTATFTKNAVVPANPIVNGGFEQGPTVGWEQAPGPVIYPASQLGGVTPYSGQYAAYLGFQQDGRREVLLGQRIQLPESRPLYLNFAAWVYSEELCDVPWYDRISIYVNGQAVYQDDRVCRGSGTDGWLRTSLDLSPLAGQSVTVVFEVYSSDALTSALFLDDLAIADRPWVQ